MAQITNPQLSHIQLPTSNKYAYIDENLRQMVFSKVYAANTKYDTGEIVYVTETINNVVNEDLYVVVNNISASANTGLTAFKQSANKCSLTDIVTYIYQSLVDMIEGGIHYRGYTTTALTDGATTNPITIDGKSYTAKSGDLVIYVQGSGASAKELEFIFNGTKWNEFGSSSALKSMAYADTASTNVNLPSSYSFTGDQKSVNVTSGTTKFIKSVTPTNKKIYISESDTSIVPSYTPNKNGSAVDISVTGGSVTSGTDVSFTQNTPTKIDTTKFSGGSLTTKNYGFSSSQEVLSGATVSNGTLILGSVTAGTQDVLSPAQIQSGFYTAGSKATLSGGKATVVTLPTAYKVPANSFVTGITGATAVTVLTDAELAINTSTAQDAAGIDVVTSVAKTDDVVSATGSVTPTGSVTASTTPTKITVHPDEN